MTSEIQQLEHEIQQSKKSVDLGNALERLLNNRDFKNIVLKGYLEQEAVRLVHLKASPAMDSPAKQASIVRDIDAIGAFSVFLNEIKRQSELGLKSIKFSEETIEAIRSEELSDE
jgi:small-conductance mechanosensitive channel